MKLVVTFALTGFMVLSCVTQLPHNKVTLQEAPVSYSYHVVPVAQDSLNARNSAPSAILQDITF